MKNKTKLIATLMALCLVVTLGVFGILAVKTLNMSVGGNITFSAEGIAFEVSKGEFKTTGGAEYTGITSQTGKMQGFAMDTNTKKSDVQDKINSWSGLDLVASESLGDPVLHFSITNKMADEILSFDQSVALGTNINDNMEIIIEPAVANIQALQTQNFTITFRVKDPTINAGLTGANYSGFAIDVLLSTAYVAEPSEMPQMTFAPTTEGATTYKVSNCSSATGDVVIPSFVKVGTTNYPVTEIAGYAFSSSEITSVEIPNTVTKIGEYAFASSNLTSITITNGVTAIGNYAFLACSKLTSVQIGNSVETIGEGSFQECAALVCEVDFPASLKTIGNCAFREAGISSVVIGGGVEIISFEAFYYCSNLTSVIIGDGVKTIVEGAFYYCERLTNIVIGKSVTSIGPWVFEDCCSVEQFTIKATTPPVIAKDTFHNMNECPIYVPSSSVATYKSATGWSEYANRIQPISA